MRDKILKRINNFNPFSSKSYSETKEKVDYKYSETSSLLIEEIGYYLMILSIDLPLCKEILDEIALKCKINDNSVRKALEIIKKNRSQNFD